MPATLLSEQPANLFLANEQSGNWQKDVPRCKMNVGNARRWQRFCRFIIMAKKKTKKQFGGITDKHDTNAGSGAFNRGSEQDPSYLDGVPGDQNDPKKR